MIFVRSMLICGCVLVSQPCAWGQLQNESDWYISWGYNRSAYANSTVHLSGTGPNGAGFNVTLHDARASDMPERFQAKVYFHPGRFTIPQFNARFGKRIATNTWFSAGWDHMKYKLDRQWIRVDGYAGAVDFSDEVMDGSTLHWSGDSLWWGSDFNFEHSDGLNFVRFSLEHERVMWSSPKGAVQIRSLEAAGAGLVVCSTDFRWAGERQKNKQHISGLGVGAHVGVRVHVLKKGFFQVTGQVGGVTLPWIRIQGPSESDARQNIAFVEGAFALGCFIGKKRP